MICSDCPLSSFLGQWLECSAANKMHKRDQMNLRPQMSYITRHGWSCTIQLLMMPGISRNIAPPSAFAFTPGQSPANWVRDPSPLSFGIHWALPPPQFQSTHSPRCLCLPQMLLQPTNGAQWTARALQGLLIVSLCALALDYELLHSITSSCL